MQVSLRVELQQRNLEELERRFWAVSDPRSAQYGNFMSVTQLRGLIAPPLAHAKVCEGIGAVGAQ